MTTNKPVPPYRRDWYSASDEEIEQFLLKEGYLACRKLDDGEWIALLPLAFTLSVCCGPDFINAYQYRWCFKDHEEAVHFFKTCKEVDEIPTRRESLKGHRYARAPLLVEYDEFGHARW